MSRLFIMFPVFILSACMANEPTSSAPLSGLYKGPIGDIHFFGDYTFSMQTNVNDFSGTFDLKAKQVRLSAQGQHVHTFDMLGDGVLSSTDGSYQFFKQSDLKDSTEGS